MQDLNEKTKELGDKYLSELVDKYDSEIAKAFVLQAGKVLNDNGIHLYVNYNTLETSVIYNSNNNTIYEQKYELSFGSLDTSEHDAKVRADAIDEFAEDIINKINFEEKWLLDCKSNNSDTNIMFSTLRTFVKNLKEKKNV